MRVERVLAVIDRNDALGVLDSGRNQRLADRRRVDVENLHRLPVEFGRLLDRLRAEFRRRDVVEQVGAGRFQRHHLRIDGRIGQFVGLLGDDHAGRLRPERVLQALDVILSEVVVLVEDADLGVRIIGQNVARIDVRLRLVVGVEGNRPREIFRIGEARRAGRGQKLRHFSIVQIFLDRCIRRGTDDLEGGENLVAFDELAHLLDRLRRTVGIVVLNEVDLAPLDAALLVDHADIGGLHLADAAIGGSRTAEGNGLAELDLRVARAGVVFLLCDGLRCERRAERQHENSHRPG